MRLGGPIFANTHTPEAWAQAVLDMGYKAAYCPVTVDADPTTIQAYQKAARQADIVIAEVGTWSNPISPDPTTAANALKKCQNSLALAEQIGAKCCVNISGSRGHQWDGPHQENLTKKTFDLIVTTVRTIIDEIKPKRTFYTLELMPWMYPNSPESYLQLIQAIDRKAFAVHLDPVNIVYSPERYFSNHLLIRECFEKLGPYIKSCHAKDISLRPNLTVHLDEVRPGAGNIDYTTFLRCLNHLDANTPLMLEHLADADEYRAAATYIRERAAKEE